MNSKFHQAQWDYYNQKSLSILSNKYYLSKNLVAVPKGESIISGTILYSAIEFLAIMRNKNKSISVKGNPKIPLDFLCEYYKNSSEVEKKELLKNYSDLAGENFNNTYQYFCDNFTDDVQQKIKIIKNIPITQFHAKSIRYEELNEYLKSNNLNDYEIHQFFIDLLKNRKNQLNDPLTSDLVKKFLKSQYKIEKLESFFSFFPMLKTDYEDLNINIFKNSHTYTTCTIVDVKNVIKKFAISSWKINDYKIHFSNLAQAVKERYCTVQHLIEVNDKKEIKIEFLHNHVELNLEHLNKIVLAYLQELKMTVPETTYSKDKSVVWLNKYLLENKLEEKPQSTKKIKI